MPSELEIVLDNALKLSPTDRAELVERILSSFDRADRQEIDAQWAQESEERIDAYDRGEIKAIPVQDVFEDIERKYGK